MNITAEDNNTRDIRTLKTCFKILCQRVNTLENENAGLLERVGYLEECMDYVLPDEEGGTAEFVWLVL